MSKKLQWSTAGVILMLGIIFFFVFKPVKINGSAMEPTYKDGANYLVNKFVYLGSFPQRGDVVTFRYTQSQNYSGIARIIGLPGDRLMIQDGKVFINGTILQERYLATSVMTSTAPRSEIRDVDEETGKIEDVDAPRILDEGQEIVIPENSYFMMGDSRENSIDSRSLGFVDRNDIVGKVAFPYKLPF
ncbi:signal peptidase I [Candidatus Roizmanbacteria bacterium]|nr:signal peptidase I [Candidatus Roizmanbacteria bacterium]